MPDEPGDSWSKTGIEIDRVQRDQLNVDKTGHLEREFCEITFSLIEIGDFQDEYRARAAGRVGLRSCRHQVSLLDQELHRKPYSPDVDGALVDALSFVVSGRDGAELAELVEAAFDGVAV